MQGSLTALLFEGDDGRGLFDARTAGEALEVLFGKAFQFIPYAGLGGPSALSHEK